jgi:hypothetical protein
MQVGCDDKMQKTPLWDLGEGDVPRQLLAGIHRVATMAAPMFQKTVAATSKYSMDASLGLDVLTENDGSISFRRYVALMGIDCIPRRDAADPTAVSVVLPDRGVQLLPRFGEIRNPEAISSCVFVVLFHADDCWGIFLSHFPVWTLSVSRESPGSRCLSPLSTK